MRFILFLFLLTNLTIYTKSDAAENNIQNNTEIVVEDIKNRPENVPPNALKNLLDIFAFDFSNSVIPTQQIIETKIAPNEIPTLITPLFETAKNYDYAFDDDYIIGLEVDGKVKGYPLRILNYHGGVNDILANKKIFVIWDAISGAVAAFERELNGKEFLFGVSGLVHNSNSLYFDQETKSLWSIFYGGAVSGKMAKKKLKFLDVFITKWKNFKQTFPEAEVLSIKTGYNNKDYTKNPYKNYAFKPGFMFPVSYTNNSLEGKETILGVIIEKSGAQSAVALPVQTLINKLQKQPINFTFKVSEPLIGINNFNPNNRNNAFGINFTEGQTSFEAPNLFYSKTSITISKNPILNERFKIETNDKEAVIRTFYSHWGVWNAFFPNSLLIKQFPNN